MVVGTSSFYLKYTDPCDRQRKKETNSVYVAQMPSLGIVIMSKNCKNGSIFLPLLWSMTPLSDSFDSLLHQMTTRSEKNLSLSLSPSPFHSALLIDVYRIFVHFTFVCRNRNITGSLVSGKLCCVSWNLQLIENESVYCTFRNHSNMQRSISISKPILHNSWAFGIPIATDAKFDGSAEIGLWCTVRSSGTFN